MAEENDGGVQDQQNREAVKRNKEIRKLNEYVAQMAYKPIKPPVASERTEGLAEMRKRNIIGTYVDHKDNMKPSGRSKRVGRLTLKYKTLTTEELEEIIQHNRKKQAKSELHKKRQQVIYHETMLKLQKQCEEQLMNAIVTKFSKEVVKRSISQPPLTVETESYQRLQKSLVCNMFLTLQIPHDQQSQDYSTYNKLASVLADLINQALFLAQNTDDSAVCTERDRPPHELPEHTEKDRCIKLRALRAAKKKFHHHWRQKSARFGGSVCSNFY